MITAPLRWRALLLFGNDPARQFRKVRGARAVCLVLVVTLCRPVFTKLVCDISHH
jgi:hypothetical protein